MRDLVLWTGPVWPGILAPYVPRGWTLVTISHGIHGGIGSDAFAAWANSLGPDPITTLFPDARRVLLFGFSAAHGAHEVLLARATERRDKRIVGVCGLDAYFVALGDTTPKPGHLAWLSWVLQTPQGRRALFTTGHTSKGTHKTGADSFGPLADALGLRPVDLHSIGPAWAPQPSTVRRRGPVTWLDFTPDQLTHQEHATKLGPLALASWHGRDSSIAAVCGAALGLLLASRRHA